RQWRRRDVGTLSPPRHPRPLSSASLLAERGTSRDTATAAGRSEEATLWRCRSRPRMARRTPAPSRHRERMNASSFHRSALSALAFGLGGALLVRPAVAKDTRYHASIDVREASAEQRAECEHAIQSGSPCELRGTVFEDSNRDGRRQHGEP